MFCPSRRTIGYRLVYGGVRQAPAAARQPVDHWMCCRGCPNPTRTSLFESLLLVMKAWALPLDSAASSSWQHRPLFRGVSCYHDFTAHIFRSKLSTLHSPLSFSFPCAQLQRVLFVQLFVMLQLLGVCIAAAVVVRPKRLHLLE